MRGTWTMQVFTDPKGSPIGERSFLVDDFVPDRVEFDITSEAREIDPGDPVPVAVDGRYLYGAPAAGLSPEGGEMLKPVRQSEASPGYQFGLNVERAEEHTSELQSPMRKSYAVFCLKKTNISLSHN